MEINTRYPGDEAHEINPVDLKAESESRLEVLEDLESTGDLSPEETDELEALRSSRELLQ